MLNPTKNLDPNTGLYIGDLEDAITLEQLYVMMKKHG